MNPLTKTIHTPYMVIFCQHWSKHFKHFWNFVLLKKLQGKCENVYSANIFCFMLARVKSQVWMKEKVKESQRKQKNATRWVEHVSPLEGGSLSCSRWVCPAEGLGLPWTVRHLELSWDGASAEMGKWKISCARKSDICLKTHTQMSLNSQHDWLSNLSSLEPYNLR